jgi:hypothetical protein
MRVAAETFAGGCGGHGGAGKAPRASSGRGPAPLYRLRPAPLLI